MSKKEKIAFVVEGDKTEPQIIYNIKNLFFKNLNVVPIILPNATNIYALWKKIKDDEEETDIIEIIKEEVSKQTQKFKKIDYINQEDFRKMSSSEFSEVYLFFDYDGHNNNLPKDKNTNDVLKQMLETFDNETENGKMYISYPMVEAIKDFSVKQLCHQSNHCFSKINLGKAYKGIVSENAEMNDFKRLDKEKWKFIIQKYINSCYCLLDVDHTLTKKQFSNQVTPIAIFDKQRHKYINRFETVMVLSAFSGFIIDYFEKEALENYLETSRLFERNLIKDCHQTKELVSI